MNGRISHGARSNQPGFSKFGFQRGRVEVGGP